MAATPISERRNSRRFSSVLSSAVLEWLLMLLLFLDALYSYLVTKFARLCKLQTPCLLCSRLDHILGNEKPDFYWDLICKAHKSEISSLAFCHVHQKLANLHDMCEGCLLTSAMEKSIPETYGTLVDNLGVALDGSEDIDLKFPGVINGSGLQDGLHGDDAVKVPLLKKDPVSFMRTCSCCSKLFRNKPHAVSLIQKKSTGVDSAEFGISLSNSIEHNGLHHQDDLSKTREKSLGPTAAYHLGNPRFDRLLHIGYSELKVNSDSESEVSSSDDEDGNTLVHGAEELEQHFDPRSPQPEPATIISNSLSTTISDDATVEKLIHPAPVMHEPSDSIPEKKLHVGESHDMPSLASSIAAEHGLEELDYSRVDMNAGPPLPKITSQDSQLVPSEVPNVKEVLESHDDVHISTTSCEEVSKDFSSAEINLNTNQIMSDPGSSVNTHMDLNDAYKLAVGNKGNLTSSNFTEVITGRDSSKVHEDLKLLITQISAAKGLETRWSDMSPSPRVYGQCDEPVLQNITKRLSIDRNESGLESLDGSIISEVEGESTVDRLKRQIELDRKSISLLYKELEEERNASAIAANQAMAMITRLQEEKAAMQMEALQYQRMMEEQAEYDQEALQKSNEVLAQREKEIQDLEEEFEIYKKRFRDGSLAERMPEKFDDLVSRENNPTSTTLEKESGASRWGGSGPLKVPLLDFEDEKEYISDCLTKLEKKLHLFSNNGVYVDLSRFDAKEDGYSDKRCEDAHRQNPEQRNAVLDHDVKNGQYLEEAPGCNDLEHPHWNNLSPENSQSGGSVLSGKKKPSKSKSSSLLSSQGVQYTTQQNGEYGSDGDGQYLSMVDKESDLTTLENEISHLAERLEALEADRTFLEHTINSLRNGDDGVQFVQEIACHLRDLRRIGITRREHTSS
ncbi:probable myosin-binding protein 4 [Elaeis guineensis]|uniref:Myosin-binding protein 1 isoform X2 n=1 Tax=Elaeis guineensis var. tenera TaxID=51953 RepID=A0A6I9S317_ELAGV|nr:myosin-binding protein 1 isoform X2 [Elaeis guineensis]